MKIFKVTYQDRALNRKIVNWEAETWEDAIIMAFSRKSSDEKLLYIEFVKEMQKRRKEMKKIPTLFIREFEHHKVKRITDQITPGCEEAFKNGVATIKFDGSCCAIIDGEFYKRYDAKNGKKPPEGAIPCCDPDPITGHWPHWVKVGDGPEDKWFKEALINSQWVGDGTYEVVGAHFQGNPYGCEYDYLWRHGELHVTVERTFEGVKKWLEEHYEEGLVFWLNGEPVCKIKRSDFGLDWNNNSAKMMIGPWEQHEEDSEGATLIAVDKLTK